MSVILPADHHATFAGWDSGKMRSEDRKSWSSRRRLGFLILCMAASWMLVLLPFLLFG